MIAIQNAQINPRQGRLRSPISVLTNVRRSA